MIQPKAEFIREEKTKGIRKQVEECINAAYSRGYATCLAEKNGSESKAYQKGLEAGRLQGIAIDGDKRYWDGYHAAQEDGKKIYQKGYEDGARCQDEVQYQNGFEDAWGMLKSICIGGRERMLKVFGTISITKIITDNTASEAVEKIREYENRQKQEEAKERFREKLESGYFSGKQKDKIYIKIGAKVRTTKDHDHFDVDVFPTGTVGTVIKTNFDCKHPYKVSANGDYWWYSADMFEVIEDEKQKRDCDTCAHNTRPWLSEECYGCTESDSHYVSAPDPTEKKSE